MVVHGNRQERKPAPAGYDSLKDILLWCYEEFTTLNGIYHIRMSKNNFSKVFWLLILLTGWTATLIHSVLVIQDFSEGRVLSSTSVYAQGQLNFPALTFCNSNHFHCGRLQKRIAYCLTDGKSNMECNKVQMMSLCALFKERQCAAGITKAEEFKNGVLLSDLSVCDDIALDELPQHLIRRDDPYMTLTKENKIQIANQPQDMIKFCSVSRHKQVLLPQACKNLLNGKVTLTSEWIIKKHYVCYSFNFNHTILNQTGEFEPLEANFMGGQDEVEIALSSEADYYGSEEVINAVYIKVHDVNEIPSMLVTPRYALQPGEMAHFSLQHMIHKRAKAPLKTNCSSTWGELDSMVVPRASYHMGICRSMCLSKFMLDTCNCTFLNDFASTEYPLCNTTAGSQVENCIINVLNAKPKCSICQPQCDENIYLVSASAGKWPSERSWFEFLKKFKITYKNVTMDSKESMERLTKEDRAMIDNHVRNNYLAVRIYFQDSNIKKIAEYPEVTQAQALSSIGGVLGLYMGASLVAMLEVLEIFFGGILLLFQKKTKTDKEFKKIIEKISR